MRRSNLASYFATLKQAIASTSRQDVRRSLTGAMQCCSDFTTLRPADSPDLLFAPMACDRKFCPPCLEHWSADLQQRTLARVRDIEPRHLRHLVLALPNCPDARLRHALDTLYAAFRNWRDLGRRQRTGGYWRGVDGYVWKLELKPKRHVEWHPHLHILLDVPRGFDLTRGSAAHTAWLRLGRALTGREVISPWITSVSDSEGAAVEVAKYSTKPILLETLSARQLLAIATATMSRRFYGGGGSLRPPARTHNPDLTWLGSLRHAFFIASSPPRKTKNGRIAVGQALAIVREFAANHDRASYPQLPDEIWII